MRRIHKKAGVGKVIAGVLMGSVVGATVGWLTAPSFVEEIRSRWMGNRLSAPEKAKNATGNLESNFRDLAEESSDPVTRPATVRG